MLRRRRHRFIQCHKDRLALLLAVIHETQSGGYEEAEHAGKDDHSDDPGGNLRLRIRYRIGSGSGLPVISGQRAAEPLRVVNEHLVRVRVRVFVRVRVRARVRARVKVRVRVRVSTSAQRQARASLMAQSDICTERMVELLLKAATTASRSC